MTSFLGKTGVNFGAFQTALAQLLSLGMIPLLFLASFSRIILTFGSFPHLKGLCSVRLVDKLFRFIPLKWLSLWVSWGSLSSGFSASSFS
jgi:ABC-type uncharacterized transport system permease subunit